MDLFFHISVKCSVVAGFIDCFRRRPTRNLIDVRANPFDVQKNCNKGNSLSEFYKNILAFGYHTGRMPALLTMLLLLIE
jgi:hypothetical protein